MKIGRENQEITKQYSRKILLNLKKKSCRLVKPQMQALADILEEWSIRHKTDGLKIRY